MRCALIYFLLFIDLFIINERIKKLNNFKHYFFLHSISGAHSVDCEKQKQSFENLYF